MKRRGSGLALFCLLTVATATAAKAPETVGAEPMSWRKLWCDFSGNVWDYCPKPIPGVWEPSVTRH